MKGRTQLSSRSPRSPRALPRQKPNSASPTSANIRWITRLIGIGGASRLPLPYGASVDLGGLARRGRANRDARRPPPRADHCSCEWSASALRYLPGLQIGRASCRGKSVDLGGRRIIKKKNIKDT